MGAPETVITADRPEHRNIAGQDMRPVFRCSAQVIFPLVSACAASGTHSGLPEHIRGVAAAAAARGGPMGEIRQALADLPLHRYTATPQVRASRRVAGVAADHVYAGQRVLR
jgi:hypothetical protein